MQCVGQSDHVRDGNVAWSAIPVGIEPQLNRDISRYNFYKHTVRGIPGTAPIYNLPALAGQ